MSDSLRLHGLVAYQAPPSMGFSRQDYWNGLPFPSPGDLPDPGIERRSPALQADTLTSEPPGKPTQNYIKKIFMTQITTMVWSLTNSQTCWNAKSSGPYEASLWTKASGGDGIPVELFQILKDDAVKVLHSICHQIWKTQQWSPNWKGQFSFQSQRKAMTKNT